MCDGVFHVLWHVFARQLHLTASVVERAGDFRERIIIFQMTLDVLSLKWITSTYVGAHNWILGTLEIVILGHIFESGFMDLAVAARVGSLHAVFHLMNGNIATPVPPPTYVLAFNTHKLASVQLVFWGRFSGDGFRFRCCSNSPSFPLHSQLSFT